MKAGDIIYFHDFEFADGGHANKIFIILSDCSKASLIAVIITSKGKDTTSHGCQPKPQKYFIKGGKHGFPKDTWVDLARNVSIFSKEKVLSNIQEEKAEVKATLPEQIVREITNCLTKHAIESLSREGCEILGVKPKW